MPPNPDARLLEVCRRLESVRGSLLQASPDVLEQSIPEMAEAADALALLIQEISSHPPPAGAEREALFLEMNQLRADLSSLAALAAQGMEFCRKWSHVLQSAAGYLPNGEAAPLNTSTTITVQG